ncbi:hypothetical protein [Rhizobium tubonense]|uniref:Uncharacterized protein n=1 Tax=Rhizobium tubonense TaxID=484088 RepID=A0A2W4E831_9HYPH|nr:hypothetical protein [Rhizobium tubonense]PZM07970.1 hypothetical protein CPY51_29910 [Rhizobium tubonense]
MKSPWNFLVQLASRGRSDETQENPTDSFTKAAEGKGEAQKIPAAKTLVPTSSSQGEGQPTQLVAETTAPVPKYDNAPPTTTLADAEAAQKGDEEANQLITGPSELARNSATRVKSPKISQPRPPAGAKKHPIDVAARSSIATNKVEGGQPVSHEDPFHNNAANLDGDIKQLRLQLAQKLRLQNTQLKEMLRRFERF